MIRGIYQIKNTLNGKRYKRYIGSAVNIKQRWAAHLSMLRHGRHYNQHLQRAFNKYGEDSFGFSILEHAEPERLIEREQHYLDTLKPKYNISPIAGSTLGRQLSVETKRKISRALSGERNPNYGKHRSRQHCRKLSMALMGHSVSAETRAKMSVINTGERNPMYGKHHSEETRRKISEANIGRQVSKETRKKMSEAQMGKHLSEEHRRKLSEAQMGKHHSDETKRKMGVARIAYWRRKRVEEQES